MCVGVCRRSRGSTPRGSRGGRGLGGGTGRGRGRGRGRGGRNKSPAPTADQLDAELDAWKQVGTLSIHCVCCLEGMEGIGKTDICYGILSRCVYSTLNLSKSKCGYFSPPSDMCFGHVCLLCTVCVCVFVMVSMNLFLSFCSHLMQWRHERLLHYRNPQLKMLLTEYISLSYTSPHPLTLYTPLIFLLIQIFVLLCFFGFNIYINS